MKTTVTTLGLLVAISTASAHAQQTITQSRDYVFNVQVANTPVAFSFDAFDTMGGTRQLTGVSISASSDFSLEMIAENAEDYAITSDDWFFEAAIFNNVVFNPEQSDEVAIFGLGGVGYGPLSADLDASDGVDQKGLDAIFYSYKDSYAGFRDALPFQISNFEGSGQIDAEIYPFLSLAISAPAPFIDLWITNHLNSGSVELTYTYTTVPAPTSACVIGGAALLATRRRR